MESTTYHREQRQGTQGNRVNRVKIRPLRHNAKPPAPCECDWCHGQIGEDDIVIYDRVRPFMVERTDAQGNLYFLEKIGTFCCEDCLFAHRKRFAGRRE